MILLKITSEWDIDGAAKEISNDTAGIGKTLHIWNSEKVKSLT